MKAFLRVFAVFVVAICTCGLHASAQQFSAVSGAVTDHSGGVVTDVSVTLDNPKLGIHTTTITNGIKAVTALEASAIARSKPTTR